MKKALLLLLAALLSFALVAPAFAMHLEPAPGVKLGFYGTNNFSTEYRFTERPNTDDVNELEWDISNTLGAFANAGKFQGRWELGFKQNTGRTDGGVYSRLLYGTYAFNDQFKLTMGQTYFPNFWWPLGSETKEGNTGTGYGASQDARTPMIRIDPKNAFGKGIPVESSLSRLFMNCPCQS